MKVNLYAIGFSVLALGFLPAEETKAQQLLSHVKTEAFNNHYYGHYDETNTGKTLTEQFYDYNDKNVITKYSSWTTSKGARKLNNQTVYTYNDDGNILGTVTEQLDYNTKELVLQGRTDYEYNADGKVESMVYQYRDYASKEMIYSYKYEYTYGSGDIAESKTYNWSLELDDWVVQPPYDAARDDYIYDGEWGHEYAEPIEGKPVYNGYDFFYNEDSTVSTSLSKVYHKKTDTWYNSSKTVTQMNGAGYNVSSLTKTWNTHCKVWVSSYKSTNKYNKNNVSVLNEYMPGIQFLRSGA
ncbi:MAG: hypothetical protein JKX73_06915 [Flavobacteriales bacterium]|nr:hypothetical protein [Flavobacteriales bacterium]